MTFRMLALRAGLVAATPLFVVSTARPQCLDWVGAFGSVGVNNSVHALTVFDDGAGAGPGLYGGGIFTMVGGTPMNRVARWGGGSWAPLGTGMDAAVNALAVFDDGSGEALFAGGAFSNAGGAPANRIAKWDGVSWTPLGAGLNGAVHALVVFDDGAGPDLYAAGAFTLAGGGAANRIARWNGVTWSAVGTGLDGVARALAVYDDGGGDELYVGGAFQMAGGAPANRVARWSGASWSALGTGTSDEVRALAVYDDGGGQDLYAGGLFTSAGGGPANALARWNGAAWSSVVGVGNGLTGGASPRVQALSVYDDGGGAQLAIGGFFTLAGNVQAANVATWDGTLYHALGDGTDGLVLALRPFADGPLGPPSLYVGGTFTVADGVTTGQIARWDGSIWTALGGGPNSEVRALAAFDDGRGPSVFAGGLFTIVGGSPAPKIARYDGRSWSSVDPAGLGMNDQVHSLHVHDDGGGAALYAGGDFIVAGGVPANRIAKWDGATWAPLASGLSARVNAMVTFNDGSGSALYAGGFFNEAEPGNMVNFVARWNGVSWTSLGTGLDGFVEDLEVFDDGGGPELYACGEFLSANGVPLARIAKWNGATWVALGSGLNNVARTLEVYDDGMGPKLYVGGRLTQAGGAFAFYVARWSGASWSSLGFGLQNGTDNEVNVLHTYDDGTGTALYVGGFFQNAGGARASRIARWDGRDFSVLQGPTSPEQGTNGIVDAMTTYDDGTGSAPALIVGGDFTAAGGKAANYVGQWVDECLPKTGVPFCFATLTTCPCANVGQPDRGCDNAQSTGGVRLDMENVAPDGLGGGSADAVGTGFDPAGSPTVLVIRSATTLLTPNILGDGILCLENPVQRVDSTTASAGSATILLDHGAGAGTFFYQLWYRNNPAAFCIPAFGFNTSSGHSLTW